MAYKINTPNKGLFYDITYKTLYTAVKRMSHGEGNDNPLQYSCLENPMDKGAWWDTDYGAGSIPLEPENTESLSHTYF